VRAGVIGTPLRNTSDHSEGEDNSDYEECVEDEMPSGECSRNGRRARLPEDPWERVSESSRVADMSEQVFFAIPMWPLPHEIHHPAQNLRFCEYRMDCPGCRQSGIRGFPCEVFWPDFQFYFARFMKRWSLLVEFGGPI